MNENRPVLDSELTEMILERLARATERNEASFENGRWCITPNALKALVRGLTGWKDAPEACQHEWQPYGWKNEWSVAKGVACWRCGLEVAEIPLTYLMPTGDRIA
jgi:hypothetical protein